MSGDNGKDRAEPVVQLEVLTDRRKTARGAGPISIRAEWTAKGTPYTPGKTKA